MISFDEFLKQDEMELKAKVDEYFEKYMCVSFDKFIENWEQTKELLLNKDKEIERLKKREQECIDHYLVQCKYASEMEDKYITANNIIKELEKDLDKQIEFCTNEANGTTNDKYCRIAINYLKHLKDKLQELKGEDKE